MDQTADDSSNLGVESSKGAGFLCLICIGHVSLTEKARVRIGPGPPSSAIKETKFSWSSYIKGEPLRFTLNMGVTVLES